VATNGGKAGRGSGAGGAKSRGSSGSSAPGAAATRRRPSRPRPSATDDVPETGDDISVEPDVLIVANEVDLKKLEQARRSRLIKAGVVALAALLLIIFVLQNAKPVPVRLVFFTQSLRLIWLVVASAALGAVGGYFVAKPDKHLRLHGPRRRREDTPTGSPTG